MKSIYGKNKDYISYSSYMLWKTSKDSYRRRYYYGEKSIVTSEMSFGKKIADLLESKDPSLAHVPHYDTAEYGIDVMIDDVRVVGRIDSLDLERVKFLDHKTGHSAWTRSKVLKHTQLPFYSLLLKERFGKVDNVCHIIWMETRFVKRVVKFAGHVLEEMGRGKLELTGRVKKFRRVVLERDRKAIRTDLLQVAREIREDYQKVIHR